MNIIKYEYAKTAVEKKRGKFMYEKLIDELKNNPASNYSIQDAEQLADKVLDISGYTGKVGAIPIIKIANNFGFATYKAKNIPSDISGNIFVGGNTKKDYNNDKVIIVGANEVFPHQRFILAHELAHYLLDYVGADENNNGNQAFSRAYLKINHDSIEEKRADRFAAELLMPKKIFLNQYIKAIKKSNYNDDYTITYLSELFKVKESCIKRRIQEVFE